MPMRIDGSLAGAALLVAEKVHGKIFDTPSEIENLSVEEKTALVSSHVGAICALATQILIQFHQQLETAQAEFGRDANA